MFQDSKSGLVKCNFVTFNCGECSSEITFETQLKPGEAGVIDCPNCKISWTVYNPSLIIKPTKSLPENLQRVWTELNK
jgi:hypothetical protein